LIKYASTEALSPVQSTIHFPRIYALLKGQALDIVDEKDEVTALQRLIRGFENVKEANLAPFDTAIKTVRAYRDGIVNYCTYRLPA
jgi:hypothetical protein